MGAAGGLVALENVMEVPKVAMPITLRKKSLKNDASLSPGCLMGGSEGEGFSVMVLDEVATAVVPLKRWSIVVVLWLLWQFGALGLASRFSVCKNLFTSWRHGLLLPPPTFICKSKY